MLGGAAVSCVTIIVCASAITGHSLVASEVRMSEEALWFGCMLSHQICKLKIAHDHIRCALTIHSQECFFVCLLESSLMTSLSSLCCIVAAAAFRLTLCCARVEF
jgi:hypothetical protein